MNLFEEALESLVMLGGVALSLSRHGDVDLGPDDGHVAGDEADVGESLLHHDGGDVGLLRRVDSGLDPVQMNAVPALLRQCELPIHLQI